MRDISNSLPSDKGVSVRTWLTLWNVGILALALIVFGAALRGIVQANLLTAVDRSLRHQAQAHQTMTARWYGMPPGGPEAPPAGPPPDAPGRPPGDGPPPESGLPPPEFIPAGVLPTRLLNLRELRLQPWSVNLPWDPDTFPLSARGRDVYSTVSARQGRLRVLSVPLRQGGHVIGVAQTAALLSDADRETAHLTRALLTLIPLVLLIAGSGGALLTGRTLRPVREVTQAANRIEAEDLSARLTVVGRDEFSALASTFNGMLERLEGAFQKIMLAYERERRFTADASHELRTPLAIIKGYTSLALSEEHTAAEYRRALEATDRAVDRTNRLVLDLLLLARADTGQYGPDRFPVRLRPILEQVVEEIRSTDGPPVYLRMASPDPVVRGNPDALGRLFINLLSNAARHTPAAGRVTVTAEAGGEWLSVTVVDTGEGIAPEHLQHLFERFYRADTGRARADGGTGLGLAICRSLVEAHGGRITIESARSVGTVVRVTLPCEGSHSERPETGVGASNGPVRAGRAVEAQRW